MTIKSEEVQSTKKKLEKLHKLLDAADQQAETRGDDTDYRERCFYKIYDAFWKIARTIGISRADYDGYEGHEDIMRSYLEQFENNNPDWLLDVLEEIEEE